MYGCESWAIKKAEHWRTDVFKLWCWRRLLRVSWTTRRSNQSILKGINPEYSLDGLMLKLKLQYFGHLMWRVTWCPETTHWKRHRCWVRLKAKGEEGGKGWDGQVASQTQCKWIWTHSRTQWKLEDVCPQEESDTQRVRHDLLIEHTHTHTVCIRQC